MITSRGAPSVPASPLPTAALVFRFHGGYFAVESDQDVFHLHEIYAAVQAHVTLTEADLRVLRKERTEDVSLKDMALRARPSGRCQDVDSNPLDPVNL